MSRSDDAASGVRRALLFVAALASVANAPLTSAPFRGSDGIRVTCTTCQRGEASPLAPAVPPPVHDEQFWQAIAEHDYTPPAGSSVPELTDELSRFLSSPDPELRDRIGYGVLAEWIYQKRIVGPDVLRHLIADRSRNLTTGLDAPGTDAVFGRSFSALVLSVVAARDNVDPFLEPGEFRQLFDNAVSYLGAEHDLRGYDPEKGWMHSAAHTADLLKFLGRSRYLTPADQAVMLQAIARKLDGAALVFTHGEDERLARAVLSLIHREDFDRDAFGRWVTQWRPAPITSAHPTEQQLRGTQNRKNLYAKLEVLLVAEPAGAGEGPRSALAALEAALKDTF